MVHLRSLLSWPFSDFNELLFGLMLELDEVELKLFDWAEPIFFLFFSFLFDKRKLSILAKMDWLKNEYLKKRERESVR